MSESSLGSTLRKAREDQGIPLEEIADRLKVRPSLIAALEEDRFTDLPEPIYTRAYLQRYAQLVSLDAAPLVAAYDRRAGVSQIPVTSVPKVSSLAKPARFAVPPLVFVVVGAAVAAGAFWIYRTLGSSPKAATKLPLEQVAKEAMSRPNNKLNAPSQGDPSVLIKLKLSVTSLPSGASVMLDRYKIGVTPLTDAPVSGGRNRQLRLEKDGYAPYTQSIELLQNRNFSVSLQKAPVASVTTPPAATPQDRNITLRFQGRSWMRVTGPGGKVLFEGIPEVGSSQSFPAPITVRAGRPDVISAVIGGVTRSSLGGANAATISLP